MASKRTSKSPARARVPKKASAEEPVVKQEEGEKVHYEFGGTPGALGVMFGLPFVIYMLYFLCNDQVCLKNPFDMDNWTQVLAKLPSWGDLYSNEGMHIYVGWMLFQLVLAMALPGEKAEGAPVWGYGNTGKGARLSYPLNGHLQFWISIACMGHVVPQFTESAAGVFSLQGLGRVPLEMAYDHYVPLITISTIGALLLSLFLYAKSFKAGAVLAKGGNTGSKIYDFFIGRELNPRVKLLGQDLDLKYLCELRPGLIGWVVLNLSMATKQYLNAKSVSADGSGAISLSMLLVTFFQGLYVWDALFQERAILTTMDITTDGFGFMLAFGDLAWVPFIYSLQARYLVDNDPQLGIPAVAACVCVMLLGYYIFRSANSEKDAFRRDPDAVAVKHLTFLQTKRGTKLITSGWWGSARKINYTGDWLITLSWCLLCGADSPVPYFQALYFAILLVHRAIRDDEMCQEKYGDDWDEYKRRVPYMFIPYVV